MGKRKQFVAYYRVSTERQASGSKKSGVKGIGLKAQQEMIKGFLKNYWPPMASFTEVQSGKSDKNRPELDKALKLCKKEKACLVVAKLDRLSRDLHFITALQKNKVDFKIVDMPSATPLTINLFGAIAEHEREMISKRTKDALHLLKKKGVKLGAHNKKVAKGLKLWRKKRRALKKEKLKKANKSLKEKKPVLKKNKRELWDAHILPTITLLHNQGKSYQVIANELNKAGVRTRESGIWHKTTVYNIVKRNNLRVKKS